MRLPVRTAGLALMVVTATASSAFAQRRVPPTGYRDWKVTTGSADSLRYSALSQINRDNVRQLQVAWTYDTGDVSPHSEMECNPIVAHDVLYATSSRLRVIALEAATGRLIWSFLPPEVSAAVGRFRNRGVTFWEKGNDRRIFVAARYALYALDARTGRPIPTFGHEGRIDLREGLGRDPATLSVGSNSPPVVYRDMIIVGSIVNESLPAAPGDVRAYDVRTGKMRWIFHTIPRPGEFGYDTWPRDAWTYTGGANSWPGMSLDEKRGLVFVPTGSAAFDFWGGNRIGDNLFANSLLALNARTGKRVWHFQAVKHDLWDRDLPAAPNLITVYRKGRAVEAVAQITKSGHVFVFERHTGRPLFPIRYESVPQSDAEGEVAATTQPVPVLPPPFARQTLTEDMLTRRTPKAHADVLERYRKMRHGFFQPPSLQGTSLFPGMDGGAEWGGAAFDPETGVLYVNSNEMVWNLQLIERKNNKEPPTARALYGAICSNCHGPEMKGNPPDVPSLHDLPQRRTAAQAIEIVQKGNRMPAFSFFDRETVAAVIEYISTRADQPISPETQELLASLPSADVKYGIHGYDRFLDPDGYPAIEPPWGTLNAINLDTGNFVWTIPFGEIPALVKQGMTNTGSENYGGPVVTAGGLLFIGATTLDSKFHAFDKITGQSLWETTLPAAGNATPAVYMAEGRQFVVIAAGGGRSRAPSGGSYVAFALPPSPQ